MARYDSSIYQKPSRAQYERSLADLRAEVARLEPHLASLEQGPPVDPDSVTAMHRREARLQLSSARRAIADLESLLAGPR